MDGFSGPRSGLGFPGFEPGRLFENIEQDLGAPDAVALGLADFPHDAGGFELANGPDGGVVGHLEFLFRAARGDEWISAQQVCQVAGGLRAGAAQAFPPAREERVDPLGAVEGVFGLAGNAVQEVEQPAVPVTVLANFGEAVVVVLPGGFEEDDEAKAKG